MWLVRPSLDVDLQSAVLGVVVSWLRGKSRLDVGAGRQVLGAEQNGEGFVIVVHVLPFMPDPTACHRSSIDVGAFFVWVADGGALQQRMLKVI